MAEIDRASIEQALFNLAANARDAMQHQGHLTIVLEHRDLLSENALQLPPGEYATITGTDTGGGMSEHTLAHIAEPFFTTKDIGKGTGLGLASVFATVAKHGGKVVVRSKLGHGATFELLLPRLRISVAPATAPTEPHATILHKSTRQTLLLVEDDESLRRAARTALERCSYRVLEARDGENAQELIANGTNFQLMVTDVIMPRCSGQQLVASSRSQLPWAVPRLAL